ncbi:MULTISPECIES: alpha/beta fold hydrolase [unclassified Paenibacillus]|uniref:alpha/beta fold hydrolase n=1 Tax=unclassified Paenibacillus TaxID=185978 RepID=UPI0003F9E7D7|nr:MULTISPECIES: alpha/beta fold hydrolase [unclassified Paenibacillus]KGP78983.1 alpha/beta hydrolase [Paenibacillus sp. MAEPY2]KGP88270.1 alpha/beta hydrolase [Paenibacillus sp. MAEPY1]
MRNRYNTGRKKRGIGKFLLVLLALIVIGCGFVAWKLFTPYGPQEMAQTAMETADQVTVTEKDNWIDFVPDKSVGVSVIFYPGGLVKPESYAPLAHELAAAGHHTIIAKMPVNLAVLKQNLADDIIKAYPDEPFVMGGHSLGGSMAARYTASHPDALKGIFFLASYPDEKGSVKSLGIPALSILGTNDEVVNSTKYQNGRAYLPEDTVYYTIEGGNHSQFGDYGHQSGDGEAGVSEEEQLSQTVKTIVGWLDTIK